MRKTRKADSLSQADGLYLLLCDHGRTRSLRTRRQHGRIKRDHGD
jgi:hypothetical protein